MIVRIFAGAVLSAAAIFGWGFLFWGISGASNWLLDSLPGEERIIAAFQEAGVASGMYVYPGMPDLTGLSEEQQKKAEEAFETQHSEGPLFQIAYRANGGPLMPREQYIAALAHPFAFALVAGILLAMAAGSLRGYGQRVVFVLLLGLLASMWVGWGDAIWWFHPWTYVMGCTAYHLVAALLMGLILAALIKPATPAAER